MSLAPTPSQTVGPFYAIGLCRRSDKELDADGVELTGQVLDGQGEPVVDAVVELWDAAGERWGRCGTEEEAGRFRFRVPRDVAYLDAYVFARGLLRHQRTRIYLHEADDEVLRSLPPDERATLIATPAGDGLRFDVRLQGERQTVFFVQ
jgi:protocatechuate 3,4-dioxygenase, alpha subunit